MSTLIVVAVAVGIAGWVNRDLIRLKIASVYARVASKAGHMQTPVGPTDNFRGEAPWALSALPECLRQDSESSGSLHYVREHLPHDAVPVAPPADLAYGDCTIAVRGEEAFVRRGSDRFLIPPRVRFYRAGALLAMLREAAGSVELRVYEPAKR